MWSFHTREYDLNGKKGEALTLTTMWVNLENMKLSGREASPQRTNTV